MWSKDTHYVFSLRKQTKEKRYSLFDYKQDNRDALFPTESGPQHSWSFLWQGAYLADHYPKLCGSYRILDKLSGFKFTC